MPADDFKYEMIASTDGVMEVTLENMEVLLKDVAVEKSATNDFDDTNLSSFVKCRITAGEKEIEDFFNVFSTQKKQEKSNATPEIRPQQMRMAKSVNQHLWSGRHLAVEAPTGIGKTFAYLLPAILFAKAKGQPVVISTHTITLQEQILDKDLPLLKELYFPELQFSIAKGRKNYLCLRRLDAVGNQPQEALPGFALSEIEEIANWGRTTKTGDRKELPFEPSNATWDLVNSDPWTCMKSKCINFSKCFLQKARAKMAESDIIIANHAIYFSDLKQRINAAEQANMADSGAGDSLLPKHASVIFDEAHTVENVASDHLGMSISSMMILRLLGRLYDAERGRGLLFEFDAARMAVVRATDYLKRYFATMIDWLNTQQLPFRYPQADYFQDSITPYFENIEGHLKTLIQDLKSADDESVYVQELQGIQRQLFDIRQAYYTFCGMRMSDCVYWLDVQQGATANLTFNAVPLELAPVLNSLLFRDDQPPVILTSATLATVKGNMSFFLKRLGATKCESVILPSEFDYKKQMTIYLSKTLPDPTSPTYNQAIVQPIKDFLLKTHGKAFILFTNKNLMQNTAEKLKDFCEDQDMTLLVQGENLQKHKMIDIFKKDINSVIFGVSSFWTGVDIPGESLSNVMIVRLPFAVPDHPVIKARSALIEQRGGSPFFEMTLPEAILQLRQGVGRLIRTKKDKGIVVIFDNRITTKNYGKQILSALPDCQIEYF